MAVDEIIIIDFDSLIATLVKCFTIIGCGYLSRKFNLLKTFEDTRAVRTLIDYFLMPAMIIQAFLTIHWTTMNWRFVACVFIAKSILFVLVAGLALLVTNDLSKAGIFGVFASDSNDMAIGCPLIKALFGSNHREYIDYVYLLVPISSMILNPVGILMMEIGRSATNQNTNRHLYVANRVLSRIGKNPMVISTIIGLMGSICLGRDHRLPITVSTILEGFSSAFVPVALFAFGFTLFNSGDRRKSSGDDRRNRICGTALLLSFAKISLLPFILRALVKFLKIDESDSSSTMDLAIFGYVYGSFPTAPMVSCFANHYHVAVNEISTALPLVTVLFAPWFYISIEFMFGGITDQKIDHSRYLELEMITAIISTVIVLICIITYITSSKIRRVPHVFVFYLLISCLIGSIGVLIGGKESRLVVVRRTMILWGESSLRLFVVFLASAMAVLRSIGLCRVLRLRVPFAVVGFSLPFFAALIWAMLSADMANKDFDVIEAYVTAASTTLCIIAGAAILIWQYRRRRPTGAAILSFGCVHCSAQPRMRQCASKNGTAAIDEVENGGGGGDKDRLLPLRSAEDDDDDNVNFAIDHQHDDQEHKCKRLLHRYLKQTSRRIRVRGRSEFDHADDDDNDQQQRDPYDLRKHSILLAVLCVSLAMSLFVALWEIFRRFGVLDSGGVVYYLQLMRLLDTILLYGQPVFILMLFGEFDAENVYYYRIIGRLRRKMRRVFAYDGGSEKKSAGGGDKQTRAICRQFDRCHAANCAKDIARTIRSALSNQETNDALVFRGADLIDWLIENGICFEGGRSAAARYARRLLIGHLIENADQELEEQDFYDSDRVFYRFIVPSRENDEDQEQLLPPPVC